MTATLLVVFTATVATFCMAQSALQTSILLKESALQDLATTSEAIHRSRCSDLPRCTSGTLGCSTPACGNTFPASQGFHCNNTFGTDAAMCGTGCNGLLRSMDRTVVRIPPLADFSSAEMQAFICSSQRLDSDFKANLDQKRTLTAWQYIGHNTGAIRIYPAAAQSRTSECGSYDARLRPWFIAASSGPKDLVIVIDRSGSMDAINNQLSSSGETRMDAVKAAVSALLGTLTQSDFVSIVTFSSGSEVLGNTNTLIRATDDNIAILRRALSNVVPSGSTSFLAAFQRAFSVLAASTERKSGCTRIVLFLTDGKADASETQTTILNTIQVGQQSLGSNPAHIFTYSMSSGASDEIPRAIACNNSGVWARIDDGSDPLSQMSQYYQFLATGINSTTVRWTAPYVDAFGLGRMVTAARAVYDRSQSVPLLVGVVGTDITMDVLEEHADFTTIVNALISRSGVCPTLSLSPCQLQHLRSSSGYVCPNDPSVATCNSRNEIVTQPTCTGIGSANSLLCENLDVRTRVASPVKSDRQVTCCADCASGDDESGVSNGVVIGIVVGVVVGAIIVVGIIVAVLKLSGSSAAEAGSTAPAAGPSPKL